MNQSAAKASKRDIRRAFGPTVAQHVADQDVAIKWLVAKVHELHAELLALQFSRVAVAQSEPAAE